ncbi:MAG: hypothetical protein ABI761_03615 [Saprospiraceae bacterium]
MLKNHSRLNSYVSIFIWICLNSIFIQCQSNQNSSLSTSSLVKDTLQTIIPFSAFELRLIDLIDSNGLHNSTLIKNHEYFDLSHIDEGYDSTYSYRLVDTLSKNPQLPVYIIAREYENEDIAWYCKYTPQHKIEFFKEVFYTNAEGNLLIESRFKQDTLTLFIDDINEGKVREVYSLDSVYKFNVIKK